MRLNKAALCLTALLALGGCGSEDPPSIPPDAGTSPDAGPTPAQLTKVTVSCAPASVVVGGTAKCTANATDQYGAPFNVTGYTWTSSDTAVAKAVDAEGNITTGPNTGTVTLTASATAGQVTQQGQATLQVTAAPATVHAANITSPETWRVANNPHVVRGSIEVTGANAPMLTLEAGVEIRFEQDAELRITSGSLKALGTAAAPIRMVADQSVPTPGYWRGVVLSTEGSASELAHVALSGCGSATGKSACVAVENKATPVLRNVAVSNSGTAGVAVANDGSAFGTGSTQLSVSGSKGYAVRIGANEAGTLPLGGTFTGNSPDAIELQGNVSRTQTWPNLNIPYVVTGQVNVEGDPRITLTISAGTVMRFARDAWLNVGQDLFGELVVDGTAAAPVLFTADSATPVPGYWKGVHLRLETTQASRISHATIEYAGGGSGIATGNLNLYGVFSFSTARPVIDNVIVQKSSGYGVSLLNGGAFGPGSTALTARDNGGYPIRVEANNVGSLPTVIDFSNNTPNAVEVAAGRVNVSQTWPNLGVPYVVTGNVSVASSNNPTLTLPAGTTVQVAEGIDFQIGNPSPGALAAVGTAEAPIRFIPNTDTPTKGHWRGIHFWSATGSKLDYVTVSHAGATGSIGEGNVNVYREIGAFVTNSTLSNSSACGITVSTGTQPGSTPVSTDFTLATYNNTFTANAGRQCIN